MEPRISLLTLGVADLPRAVRFYREGLGFSTTYEEGGAVAFFRTGGVRLALYPFHALVEDISPGLSAPKTGSPGITIAHNVREKAQVAEVLALAEKAGGTIVKPAQDVFWGGHSGYFRDLDGHYWEVAWNPFFEIGEGGLLEIG
jgi:catechol 2,3-dioxygenase-like lactoylglutathione lyase family enzyme